MTNTRIFKSIYSNPRDDIHVGYRPKSLPTHRSNISGLSRQLAGYTEMLAVARKFDLAFDVDRLVATVAEFEGELDDAMCNAAYDGFGPEDFDD